MIMEKKIKIKLVCLVIVGIIVVSIWWILSGHPSGETSEVTKEYRQVIQKSTWSYDLQNPEHRSKHVSAAPKNITEKYLPIWKKLFMEKNKISENYYNKHIRVIETGISTDQSRNLSPERGREYFEVLYRIKIDWIEFSEADHLVIRKKNQTEYLSIEEFIDEEESAKEKFQKVSSFIPIEGAPLSFEDAVQKLKQINSDAKYLKPVYLTLIFKSPSYDTEQIANGGILLYGEGTIDFENNQCVEGYINLVTEKGSTMRVRCWTE